VIVVALMVEEQDRIRLASIGDEHHWDVHFADTREAALAAANELVAPIILCDRDLPGTEWRDAVQALSSSPHRACVILISKVLDEYLRNEMTRKGGYDVLAKPLQEADVVRAVKLASSYWNSTMGVT
jgi:FixJ family two-component response regulator